MLKNIKPDKLPDITDEIRLSLHKKYAKPYILYKNTKLMLTATAHTA